MVTCGLWLCPLYSAAETVLMFCLRLLRGVDDSLTSDAVDSLRSASHQQHDGSQPPYGAPMWLCGLVHNPREADAYHDRLCRGVLHLAVRAVTDTSRALPARVRAWYTTVDRDGSMFLDGYFEKHVSPLLFETELAAIADAPKSRDWDAEYVLCVVPSRSCTAWHAHTVVLCCSCLRVGASCLRECSEFTVWGSSVSRDVHAKYIQDETDMSIVRARHCCSLTCSRCELTVFAGCGRPQKIHVPDSYPLRRVQVSAAKRGVSEAHWRKWELQMVTLLSTKVLVQHNHAPCMAANRTA